MIYEFQVTSARDVEGFIKDFEKRIHWIKQKGYSLTTQAGFNQEYGSNLVSFILDGQEDDSVFRAEDIIYIFKHQISEALAEHIFNDWEDYLLWKEISRSYKNLSNEDKKAVFAKSRQMVRKRNDNESLNMLFNYGRKNRVTHRILEQINNNTRLVIEGFINFCMQDFITELKYIVELACEELKSEQEYNEFINLLRYFVNTQSPKVYEVNLLIKPGGLFTLWDENGDKIDDKYINYYLDDILHNEINLDDVLISILVTIAPRRVVIHNAVSIGNSKPIEMIRNVFNEKIQICAGCDRCFNYIKLLT